MKRIAAIAILATNAAQAYAIAPPYRNTEAPAELRSPPIAWTYCLDMKKDEVGNVTLGTCDRSEENYIDQLKINANGCAEEQAALTIEYVYIPSCLPMVQL